MNWTRRFKYGLMFLMTASSIVACNNADESTSSHQERAAGELRTDKKGIQQVWVVPDTFQMGTSDSEATAVRNQNPPAFVIGELPSEQPKHLVRITQGYWIDKYEITYGAFQAFADDSGYYKTEFWSDDGKAWLAEQNLTRLPFTTGREVANQPRVNVTWYEAEAYSHWRGGRLPTEAEWEFGARGPHSLIYPWGNTFDTLKANVVQSSSLTPAGNYPEGASWVGALDMAGNAMEWVQDWLDVNYYEQNICDDPPGPAAGTIKIEKGGWWGSNPFVARSAYRHFEDPPGYRDGHIGFRIVTSQ